jgi:demethylmenaquinone methyltransferase / 2-methoxy-6-polyprenyl-1,4-benzoquinol methylase
MRIHDGYNYAHNFFTAKNAATYDSVVRYATFGQDRIWKNEIAKIVDSGNFISANILDLAAGTGILSSMLEGRSSKADIHSLDLTLDYLKLAKEKSQRLYLVNSTAELLPFRAETFDSVVSSYLAKYVNIHRVVQESWRVLKHTGIVVFHDFAYPTNSVTEKLWKFYFSLLKLSGKIIRGWAPAFQRLDELIRKTHCWPEDIIECLKKSGFVEVICKYYSLGTSAIISARKK